MLFLWPPLGELAAVRWRSDGIPWPGVFLYSLARLPGVTHEYLVDAITDALRQMAAKSAWSVFIQDEPYPVIEWLRTEKYDQQHGDSGTS